MEGASEKTNGPMGESTRFFTIDRKMIPSKISYFAFYAATSQYGWYINIFLTSIGLSSTEAGFITGLCFGSSAIAGPIWGALSDYTGKRRLLFLIVCLFAAFSFFSLPWIAEATTLSAAISEEARNITRNETYIFLDSSFNKGNHQSIIFSDIDSKNYSYTSMEAFTSKLFWIMLFCLLIINIFLNPLAGLVDSMVMRVIKKHGNTASYGLQRLYGSIGGGLTPLLAGILADYYHSKTMSKYTAIFFLYLPFMLLVLPAGLYLLQQGKPETDNKKTQCDDDIGISNQLFDQIETESKPEKQAIQNCEDAQVESSKHDVHLNDSKQRYSNIIENNQPHYNPEQVRNNLVSSKTKYEIQLKVENDSIKDAKIYYKDTDMEQAKTDVDALGDGKTNGSQSNVSRSRLLLDVIKNPDNFVFMVTVLVEGLLLCITQFFLSLTMTDEMNATSTAGGVAMATHGLAEFLMFPFGKRLIKFLGGPIHSIQIGLFGYFVRHILISVIKNQWLVIAPQLLNSITFALFLEAIMEYTQTIAPTEIHAIMFTTIYMLHGSLPGLLGNIFGGILYHRYGGPTLYRGSGCLALFWCIFVFLYFDGFKKIKSKFTRKKMNDRYLSSE